MKINIQRSNLDLWHTFIKPKRSSIKEPQDEVQMAKGILDELTADVDDNTQDAPESKPEKNLAAVALGRLSGLKGGKARAAKPSPKKREAIVQKAAQVR